MSCNCGPNKRRIEQLKGFNSFTGVKRVVKQKTTKEAEKKEQEK